MKKSTGFSPRMNMLQFRVLAARYLKQVCTNPWTIIPLILEGPFLLVITSFIYEDGAFQNPWAHFTAANTTLFLMVMGSTLMGLLNSYREICKEREILAREVFGGLDITAYVMSKVAILALVALVQSAILVGGSMIFIDFNLTTPGFSVFFFFAAVFLTNCAGSAMGLLVSALLKKSESAILPVLAIIIMQVVFAGSVLEFDFPVKALYFVTPTMYGTSILGSVMHLDGLRVIYDYNIYGSCALLIVIILFCYLMTTLKLKRDYRTKD